MLMYDCEYVGLIHQESLIISVKTKLTQASTFT